MIKCPDCGSDDVTAPDKDGWRLCNACGTDFDPDADNSES